MNRSPHCEDCSSQDFLSNISAASNDESVMSMQVNLAKRESVAVSRLRWLVFAVLLIGTVIVAILVYLYLSTEEKKNFEKSFQDNAMKILESLGSSLKQSMVGLDAFVISMVRSA